MDLEKINDSGYDLKNTDKHDIRYEKFDTLKIESDGYIRQDYSTVVLETGGLKDTKLTEFLGSNTLGSVANQYECTYAIHTRDKNGVPIVSAKTTVIVSNSHSIRHLLDLVFISI